MPDAARLGEIEIHHLIIFDAAVIVVMLHTEHAGGFTANHVAAPVNQLQHLPQRRGAISRVGPLAFAAIHRRPAMAEQQPRIPDSRGDQLLEPHGGRRQSPRELRHERHAGRFHPLPHVVGLFRFEIEGRGAVDRLARLARRVNRQRPVPLGREQEHGLHVVALAESAEAAHFVGLKITGGLLSQMAHFGAHGPNLEAIGEHRSAGRWLFSQASPRPMMPTRSFMPGLSMEGDPAQVIGVDYSGKRDAISSDFAATTGERENV